MSLKFYTKERIIAKLNKCLTMFCMTSDTGEHMYSTTSIPWPIAWYAIQVDTIATQFGFEIVVIILLIFAKMGKCDDLHNGNNGHNMPLFALEKWSSTHRNSTRPTVTHTVNRYGDSRLRHPYHTQGIYKRFISSPVWSKRPLTSKMA